jgi:hypothetical protein
MLSFELNSSHTGLSNSNIPGWVVEGAALTEGSERKLGGQESTAHRRAVHNQPSLAEAAHTCRHRGESSYVSCLGWAHRENAARKTRRLGSERRWTDL